MYQLASKYIFHIVRFYIPLVKFGLVSLVELMNVLAVQTNSSGN